MALSHVLNIVFFLIISLPFYGQDDTHTVIANDSLKWKKKYPNKITTRLFMINTSNSLEIQSRQENFSINLNANKQDRLGASVGFRSIVISFGFSPNFLSENRNNQNSKLFNLNFRNYFGQWMQTIDLYKEKGFFIEEGDVSLYLPKTTSLKIGGGTSYIFNENFSFRAIVSQDERQLKSAGSFIPRLVYYYSEIDVIYTEIDSKLKSFDIALAPSYYYNYVPTKNLLLSAGASAGLGFNYSESDSESLTSLLTEINFRGSVSYDRDNIYLGAHYSYLILNHNSDRNTYIKDNIPYFEIFLGYRFNAPKSLMRTSDKINNNLGL
jgi:hypothetical protein